MKLLAAPALAAAGLLLATPCVDADCKALEVDFIILEGEANLIAFEADIRADLAEVGVTANLRALPKDDFNEAMTSGDFNLAFSETWGPP